MSSRLISAAQIGDLDQLKAACVLGDSLGSVDDDGRTVLSWAASFGKSVIVEFLLELEEFAWMINKTDNAGWSPLMLAVSGGHELCVRLLLPRADLRRRNGNGKMAIHYHKGRLAIVRDLISFDSALLEEEDSCGNTSLLCSVRSGQCSAQLLSFFIEKQANLTKRNRDGNTILHMISLEVDASEEKLMMIRLLLNNGAKGNSRNKNGLSPYDVSCDESTRKLLIDFNGPHINNNHDDDDSGLIL